MRIYHFLHAHVLYLLQPIILRLRGLVADDHVHVYFGDRGVDLRQGSGRFQPETCSA